MMTPSSRPSNSGHCLPCAADLAGPLTWPAPTGHAARGVARHWKAAGATGPRPVCDERLLAVQQIGSDKLARGLLRQLKDPGLDFRVEVEAVRLGDADGLA